MKARPKTKPWVANALTGENVSPDLDWLINKLAALNPLAANDYPGVVDYHAHQIRGHWLAWRWRGDNTAIKIKGTQRPHAKRYTVDRGTENELKRLLVVARGRSDRRWQTAWLGVSGKTHSLIPWLPVPPVIRREVDSAGKLLRFERANVGVSHRRLSVRRLEAIMPHRIDALPLIEAALRKLQAIPAAERRKRERDKLADDFVAAVRMAHRVMVHDSKVLHGNGLARLGRGINERFHCDFVF